MRPNLELTPEAEAPFLIDEMLEAAGWAGVYYADADFATGSGVVIREFVTPVGPVVDPSLASGGAERADRSCGREGFVRNARIRRCLGVQPRRRWLPWRVLSHLMHQPVQEPYFPFPTSGGSGGGPGDWPQARCKVASVVAMRSMHSEWRPIVRRQRPSALVTVLSCRRCPQSTRPSGVRCECFARATTSPRKLWLSPQA